MTTPDLMIIAGGLIIGTLFGFLMQRSRFCMVAAVSNAMLIRDYRQAQAFITAAAVAVIGVAFLETLHLVPVAESAYRSIGFNWLGATAGGLVFGFGATLAGGCAARTLVNAAEGNINSMLALLTMLLFAGMIAYGALQPLRSLIIETTMVAYAYGDGGIPSLLGLPVYLAAIIVFPVSMVIVFRMGSVTRNMPLIASGVAFGVLVVAAWAVNGWWAVDVFNPTRPSAVAVAGPLARILRLLAVGSGSLIDFGVLFVAGLIAGSWFSAMLRGGYRLRMADPGRVPHQLVGGAMMGVGAGIAGGCNLGQGLSGISTLSLCSLLAVVSMVGGVVLGVRWWERRV